MPSPIRDAILNMSPNPIGAVSRRGMGQKDVIPLWFGETDLVTPDFIRDAAKAALDEGHTFYTFAGGHPRLRTAIVDWTRRWYGVALDLDRVWVPGSAMLSVVTALLCCVETGDEVIVVSPMWPNISQAIAAVGGQPRYLRLDHDAAAGRWRLDLDALASMMGPRTKAVFVGSPGNPTGWVMAPDEQRRLLELARAKGVAIISDEVYGVLSFGARRAPSFLDLATDEDDVFVVNSFSKAWAMTGWRIGWLVAPVKLARAMAQLSVNLNTGATSFAQWGAVAALEKGDEFVRAMQARCAAGRAIVADWIAGQNRLSWVEPEGAFYAYVAIEGMSDSVGFAIDLLERAKVGVAPVRPSRADRTTRGTKGS